MEGKKLVLSKRNFISGSIFLVIADTVARIIIPNSEMSIGIITSLVGAPFFAYILIKKSNSFK